jgi:hypothetical protein
MFDVLWVWLKGYSRALRFRPSLPPVIVGFFDAVEMRIFGKLLSMTNHILVVDQESKGLAGYHVRFSALIAPILVLPRFLLLWK